jgi:glycerol-3-phosphate dehydrogenase (NAD(P)+)
VSRVGVVGAGSWGTTLADLLARQGHDVTLWAWEAEVVESINADRMNRLYLDGCALAPELRATGDARAAVREKELVLCAVPSHALRAVMSSVADGLPGGAPVVGATKGLETGTLKRMSQVMGELAPSAPYVALSGPSFAAEVYAGQPTAVVAASEDDEAARLAQEVFSSGRFRVYTGRDVVGVEIAAALKNVMAIAAGILEGLGLGHNPRAALITRGLAEMTRLGVALGAEAATFAGLAGMGDLVLTATGGLSRNRSLGVALGRGQSLDEYTAGQRTVAEGVNATRAALELARRHGVEMPITDQVAAVLFRDKAPSAAVTDLMERAVKAEHDT